MNEPRPAELDLSAIQAILTRLQQQAVAFHRRIMRLERLTLPLHDRQHPLNQARAKSDEG